MMDNKKIFFTNVPYTGCYKYKDQFLIYPAPIKIEEYIHHKPAIIEFNSEEAKPEFFTDSHLPTNIKFPVPPDTVQAVSDQHKCNELLRLLSLLTNYSHFGYTLYQAWFVPIGSERKGFPSAKWGQEMVPKIGEKDFNPVSEEVGKKDSLKYYGDNLFKRITNEITYPDSIEQLLDKYFELEELDKQALDKSIRLFNQGLEVKTKMPSMAIVAFISAIENIITYDNIDEPEDTCKCGEIKYGVTKKFKKFVSSFIKAESKRKRDKYVDNIYTLRSQIVHAGGLHIGDLDRNFWEKEKGENPFMLNEIEQIARICLINWFKNKQH